MSTKYKVVVGVILVLTLIFLWVSLSKSSWDGRMDFRIARVSSDGLWLVSVSPERKMVNVVRVDSKAKIWIPGGLGWYQVGVLKKIISQENLYGKWGNILFYNFGFVADKLVVANVGEVWDDWSALTREMGWLGYAKYLWVSKQMLVRNSLINGGGLVSGEILDETMSRDLADSGVLADNIGVAVINNTGASGLASFVSRRLEWSGVGVNSSENGEEKTDGCEFRTNRQEITPVMEKVMGGLMGCKILKQNKSAGGGDELFLGESFAQMINYSSYLEQE